MFVDTAFPHGHTNEHSNALQRVLFHLSSCTWPAVQGLPSAYNNISLNHAMMPPHTEGRANTDTQKSTPLLSTIVSNIFTLSPGETLKSESRESPSSLLMLTQNALGVVFHIFLNVSVPPNQC